MKHAFRFPTYYVMFIAIIFFLLFVHPMFNNISAPVSIVIIPWIILGWAVSVYGTLYWRAKSFVVVTDSGLRQSANLLKPLAQTDLGGDPFPPMTLQLVGGAAWGGAAISDKDALLVRKSAVERFGKRVMLVYAPTHPFPGEILQGIAPTEADQAIRSSHSGFVAKAGSMLHFSLLDTLHGIDSQRFRAEETYIVDKMSVPMAHTRAKVYKGTEYYVKKIRGLAAAIRRETPRERFGGMLKPNAEAEAQRAAEAERSK